MLNAPFKYLSPYVAAVNTLSNILVQEWISIVSSDATWWKLFALNWKKENDSCVHAFRGGEMFFMRSPEDLSSMYGDITLVEFCEELPPCK